ncbi:MAG: alpha/beta fold hydrolase, partial [Elusimicrobia bacterium]|nr:alpha/beta fold hydrolase [Elusimicrobiota bacterium]
IGYEARGAGEPVLFIAGLGRDRRMWDAQTAALGARLRTVAFDNRGVGESSRPAGPYTAAQMAEDAVGLLDALELPRAHVVGASLGGVIAQELAMSFPHRVGRLALLCTHPGQPWAVPMSQAVLAAIVPAPEADPYDRLLGAMKLAFGSRYWEAHAAELAAAARARLSSLPTPESWWAQAAAGAGFAWAGRKVKAPTLVMTGDDDNIVPAANSATLRRLIPGAELAVIPGGGHYFFAEHPEPVNRLLADFLFAGEGEAPADRCRKETMTCPSRT